MIYDAEIVVVGCGNVLFKDDGFGPRIIEELEEYFKEHPEKKPKNLFLIDAGTAGPYYVFSLPSDTWKKMIVVDVVDFDAKPGTLREFDVEEIPKRSYENLHSWSVESQPLHDLNEKVDITVLGCKAKDITSPDVEMGLSKELNDAIPEAIDIIVKKINE